MRRWIVIGLSVFAALAFVTIVGIAALRSFVGARPTVAISGSNVLTIDLDGLVVERAPSDLFQAGFENAAVELFDLKRALDRAATDDRIEGLLLRVGAPGYGWAKAEEIRRRVEKFRESGKVVHAYTSFTDELGYYVALSADSIHLLPDAGLELNGFRVEAPFVRELLDKLGLEAQVEAIGAYKTAPDMFQRQTMSDAHREVTESILADRYERFVSAVVTSRGVDRMRLEAALDAGVYLARDLLALGLIDSEAYETDLRDGVGHRAVSLDDYLLDLPSPRVGTEGTIGLVYAVGTITGGDSDLDPMFGRTMGARSTVEMLREVAEDDDLDAVVIRVDSPGGDALASEEIWAAIEDVKERVPVVVSMGDVAASGGYLIAAAADEIVAEPATITGSIGVFGVLFNAAGAWDKLGVDWDTVQTNPTATFPTSTRALTEAERQTFRSLVADIYRAFVERVAAGRPLSESQVDAVAQGRVWTGAQALENGLVDGVGGLDTALEAAKRRAGIDPDARVRLHVYPAKQRLIDHFRELLFLRELAGRESAPPIPAWSGLWVSRELPVALTGFAALMLEGPRRPLMVLPYVPVVR